MNFEVSSTSNYVFSGFGAYFKGISPCFEILTVSQAFYLFVIMTLRREIEL